jgi:catechol 2,3-dioxygenase-like lactoylglutathione lyase family enzyme
MPIKLHHTIIESHNAEVSAQWLATLFNLQAVKSTYFWDLQLDNDVTLHFMSTTSTQEIAEQHYAFHVEDVDFDRILNQLTATAQQYWADPAQRMPQQINAEAGGRGLYFESPDGHSFEVFTQPPGRSSLQD